MSFLNYSSEDHKVTSEVPSKILQSFPRHFPTGLLQEFLQEVPQEAPKKLLWYSPRTCGGNPALLTLGGERCS